MTDNKRIDPLHIPSKRLYNGSHIPSLGLGTFGSDKYSSDEIAEAVKFAVRTGYRHLDCASVYQNEKEIGYTIKELINDGTIIRKDLWITSKAWNDQHKEVEKACIQSLRDLQTDYLDLYLVHWPFPNYHSPGCSADARNPDSVPFKAEEFLNTWKQMEILVKSGKVRNIGTSNMTIPKFEAVLPHMEILPVANQMEIHPTFQQEELFNYLLAKNIQPIGYSPLGSPSRPARDKTPEDAVDMEDPVVIKISERLNVHPAVVCIKWAIQRGGIAIPFSVKPKQIKSNLLGVVEKRITDEEMEEMKKAEKGSRLIKGHVFLWEGASGWEDLWDPDGIITE